MAFLDSLRKFVGMENPADAAMPYLEGLGEKISPYYQPYIDAGGQMLPGLTGQYGQLMEDPGQRLAKFGAGFQAGPGYEYAVKQAMRASNQAAAAGGMQGTPQNQLQNMEIAQQLANQEYYNYLDRVTGLYGQGLAGGQQIAGMGMQAGMSLADQLAAIGGSQANLAFAGSQAEQQQRGAIAGGIAGAAGNVAGFFL